MSDASSDPASRRSEVTQLRRATLHHALASERYRAALANRLGLGANEILAVQHLCDEGRLTPSQLAARLRLSSAGVSALLGRLSADDCVLSEPHPDDGRSVLLQLTPRFYDRLAGTMTPLNGDLDGLASQLAEKQSTAMADFLETVASRLEQHADDLDGKDTTPPRPPAPPALWG